MLSQKPISWHIFKIISFFVILFNSQTSFAWTGYDHADGSEIEISSGNLVREGEEIRFYDWKSEEDRLAQVRTVDGLLSGVRLEIYDYSAKEIRIFDME